MAIGSSPGVLACESLDPRSLFGSCITDRFVRVDRVTQSNPIAQFPLELGQEWMHLSSSSFFDATHDQTEGYCRIRDTPYHLQNMHAPTAGEGAYCEISPAGKLMPRHGRLHRHEAGTDRRGRNPPMFLPITLAQAFQREFVGQ